MSSDSSANAALTDYLAGRLTTEQFVAAVAAAYYRDAGNGMRDALRQVLDVIERAHPGIVELSSAAERPGFAVKLALRPFPKRYEAELRDAVSAALQTHPASRITHPAPVGRKPSLLKRIVAAIRRVFSGSV